MLGDIQSSVGILLWSFDEWHRLLPKVQEGYRHEVVGGTGMDVYLESLDGSFMSFDIIFVLLVIRLMPALPEHFRIQRRDLPW
jgi:hypothetical protein